MQQNYRFVCIIDCSFLSIFERKFQSVGCELRTTHKTCWHCSHFDRCDQVNGFTCDSTSTWKKKISQSAHTEKNQRDKWNGEKKKRGKKTMFPTANRIRTNWYWIFHYFVMFATDQHFSIALQLSRIALSDDAKQSMSGNGFSSFKVNNYVDSHRAIWFLYFKQ